MRALGFSNECWPFAIPRTHYHAVIPAHPPSASRYDIVVLFTRSDAPFLFDPAERLDFAYHSCVPHDPVLNCHRSWTYVSRWRYTLSQSNGQAHRNREELAQCGPLSVFAAVGWRSVLASSDVILLQRLCAVVRLITVSFEVRDNNRTA